MGHLPAMVELFGLPSSVEILASPLRLVPRAAIVKVNSRSFRAGVRRQSIVAGVLSLAVQCVAGVDGPMLQAFWRRVLGDLEVHLEPAAGTRVEGSPCGAELAQLSVVLREDGLLHAYVRAYGASNSTI